MISQYGYYRMINRRKARTGDIIGVNKIFCWLPNWCETVFCWTGENGLVNNSVARHIVPCCFLMAMLPLSLLGKNSGTESTSNFEHHRIGRSLLSENLQHGGPLLPTVSLMLCALSCNTLKILYRTAQKFWPVRTNLGHFLAIPALILWQHKMLCQTFSTCLPSYWHQIRSFKLLPSRTWWIWALCHSNCCCSNFNREPCVHATSLGTYAPFGSCASVDMLTAWMKHGVVFQSPIY